MSKRWKYFICLGVTSLTMREQALCSDLPTYITQPRMARPVELQRRAPSLDEMIKPAPYASAGVQPIPLHGVKVMGLEPKSVDTLGFNYFIVVDNTKYQRMSDVYKETRLAGKSNFVTTDSIIHPYLAFTNRVLADVSTKHIKPDLLALLEAMQQICLKDYRQAEDAEVREDLARNVAYLAVGIKLLRPDYQIPAAGDAAELAETDLRAIFCGRPAPSAIFNKREDFTIFKPIGWYNTSPELQNFYRCRQWLSQVPFPIDDASSGDEGHSTNVFRRSVLLFRSLDSAKIAGKPAMDTWHKLLKTMAFLGTPVDSWQERVLYPTDYKLVFQERPADLRVALAALAEPLYRTKLMLAIRKQKPLNLSATSIFELDESESSGSMANFRLFPVVCQPEMRWMHRIAKFYPNDKQTCSSWPIGLLAMYAQGAAVAGNILTEIMWTLDPAIASTMPDLQHSVWKRVGAGQSQPIDSRSWKVLGSNFKPLPEGAPSALRTDLWGCRKLLSAMGGWVDALAAIAPPSAAPDLGGEEMSGPGCLSSVQATTATDAAKRAAAPGQTPESARAEAASEVAEDSAQPSAARRRSKIPAYHYLEPSVDTFRELSADAIHMQADLTAANYISEEQKRRFGDFTRLFQRLEKIADTEVRGVRLNFIDQRLLANIDQVLAVVDVPLPAVISFESTAPRRQDSLQMAEPRNAGVFQRPIITMRSDVSSIPLLPQTETPATDQSKPQAPQKPEQQQAKPPDRKNQSKAAQPAPIALHSKTQVLTGGTSIEDDALAPPAGFNLAIGRPGLLCIVYQNPHTMEWTLGRGAVYTYYEMPAPLLNTSMWQHKIDAGFAKPLNWTGKFEVVQQLAPGSVAAAATKAK